MVLNEPSPTAEEMAAAAKLKMTQLPVPPSAKGPHSNPNPNPNPYWRISAISSAHVATPASPQGDGSLSSTGVVALLEARIDGVTMRIDTLEASTHLTLTRPTAFCHSP